MIPQFNYVLFNYYPRGPYMIPQCFCTKQNIVKRALRQGQDNSRVLCYAIFIMRYFIGSLLRGEVAEYYKTTCIDLANRFGIANVAEIVPPHITVKTSFEKPNPEAIDECLSLNTEVPTIPISLSNWNHFGTRTIYMEGAKPSDELKAYANDIIAKLKAIGIPTVMEERELHIRMSVARFLNPKDYQLVWNYLQTVPAPKFDLVFDNLTIFYKENKDDKAWKVLKTFPLTGIRK